MFSIVIPIFNEEQILKESVNKLIFYLSKFTVDYEIILVSNGSTDNTNEIGLGLENTHNVVRFFCFPEKGVGAAFVKGVREAKGGYIISLDIDLSSDLAFIDYSIDLIRHVDMVVGSKTMGEQRRSLFRVIPSQTYILFTQLLFDLTISDYSIGCKAYRKSSILEFLDNLDNWTGYVLELCVLLKRKGAKIIQIGIDCDDQRASHFNLLHEGCYRYYHLFKIWKKNHK